MMQATICNLFNDFLFEKKQISLECSEASIYIVPTYHTPEILAWFYLV